MPMRGAAAEPVAAPASSSPSIAFDALGAAKKLFDFLGKDTMAKLVNFI
ncbi:MAG: hypothetical protein U0744_20780 [Gemmataceae bacterium]